MTVKQQEKIARFFLWTAATITVGFLFLIIGYIVKEGIGVVNLNFLLDVPRKMGAKGGIFPSILGTLYLIAATLVFAIPIGVGAAIYLNEYTREGKITRLIRFGTEALAGIPSIIFGLFGFAFFVILLRPITGGWSILSGSLTGAIMVLPTIVRTSEEALKTVPLTYREGSLALGASKWQTVSKVVLPAAIPGILTGIILAIGRVVGETAALLLTLGGTLLMPHSLFDGARTMSMHLYMVAMETGAMEMAFGTAVVLIITILIINTAAGFLRKKLELSSGRR
ncbi:phosphate ABC transporter permease PstA [Candidatus Formimonas warabiya]|uniref:Phosphate transport system permease protein PstA n=1 Tax=Formimonas warabiya TaxID=1761012 RepID=A0A3G1KN12_FORW1|nr:phosphate ABC transporter permease PstA [Candidatus Formimonas warabiya]ATW23871.1 phosphate ABC transporter, permease protein PstA [Candidatus Formimonas warabiya]